MSLRACIGTRDSLQAWLSLTNSQNYCDLIFSLWILLTFAARTTLKYGAETGDMVDNKDKKMPGKLLSVFPMKTFPCWSRSGRRSSSFVVVIVWCGIGNYNTAIRLVAVLRSVGTYWEYNLEQWITIAVLRRSEIRRVISCGLSYGLVQFNDVSRSIPDAVDRCTKVFCRLRGFVWCILHKSVMLIFKWKRRRNDLFEVQFWQKCTGLKFDARKWCFSTSCSELIKWKNVRYWIFKKMIKLAIKFVDLVFDQF